MDQLPRLGKRELICLVFITCNYVVSVWRGFLFLWVLGMGYVILLWHSLSLSLIILETTKSRKHSMVKSSGFDRFMTSEGTETLILAITSKTGRSVAHTRHRIF